MSGALQSTLNAAASKKIKNIPSIVWRSPYTGKNIRSTSPINSNKSFHSLEETNYYKTTDEFKAEILHHINLNKAREKWRGNAKLMGLYNGFVCFMEAKNLNSKHAIIANLESSLTFFFGIQSLNHQALFISEKNNFLQWLTDEERNLSTGKRLEWVTVRAKIQAYNHFIDYLIVKKDIPDDRNYKLSAPRRDIRVVRYDLDNPMEIKCYPKALMRKGVKVYSARYYSMMSGKMEIVKGRYFPTASEAKAWLSANAHKVIIKELEWRKNNEEWASDAALVVIVEQFINFRKAKRPRSWRNDDWSLKRYILPFFAGSFKLKKPDAWGEFQDQFVEYLLNEAKTEKQKLLSRSSVEKVVNTYNVFREYLVKNVLIKKNDVDPIRLEEKTREEIEQFEQIAKNNYIQPDVIFKAIKLLRDRNKDDVADLMVIQYSCALRLAESVALSPDEIQSDTLDPRLRRKLEDEGFRVPIPCLRLTSQPANAQSIKFGIEHARVPLKWRKTVAGEKGTEYVPILDDVAVQIIKKRLNTTLKKYKDYSVSGRGAPDIKFYQLVPIRYHTYAAEVRSILIEVTGKDVGSHALRHSRITELYLQLKDSEVCKKIARHRSEVAHSRYIHLVEAIEREINRDEIIDGLEAFARS